MKVCGYRDGLLDRWRELSTAESNLEPHVLKQQQVGSIPEMTSPLGRMTPCCFDCVWCSSPKANCLKALCHTTLSSPR